MRTLLIMNGKTESAMHLNPEDFDTKEYEGHLVFQTPEGIPVALLSSVSSDPPRWCVMRGGSCSYFADYFEAVATCQARGYTLVRSRRKKLKDKNPMTPDPTFTTKSRKLNK